MGACTHHRRWQNFQPPLTTELFYSNYHVAEGHSQKTFQQKQPHSPLVKKNDGEKKKLATRFHLHMASKGSGDDDKAKDLSLGSGAFNAGNLYPGLFGLAWFGVLPMPNYVLYHSLPSVTRKDSARCGTRRWTHRSSTSRSCRCGGRAFSLLSAPFLKYL